MVVESVDKTNHISMSQTLIAQIGASNLVSADGGNNARQSQAPYFEKHDFLANVIRAIGNAAHSLELHKKKTLDMHSEDEQMHENGVLGAAAEA